MNVHACTVSGWQMLNVVSRGDVEDGGQQAIQGWLFKGVVNKKCSKGKFIQPELLFQYTREDKI